MNEDRIQIGDLVCVRDDLAFYSPNNKYRGRVGLVVEVIYRFYTSHTDSYERKDRVKVVWSGGTGAYSEVSYEPHTYLEIIAKVKNTS